MKYQELVDVYEALAATTKRLEKTEILSNFFKTVDSELIDKVTLLCLGKVFPSWSEEEQGIGDKLVMKAVADVAGVSVLDVENEVNNQGDIGAASEVLVENKKQMTFFSQALTIEFVFNNLRNSLKSQAKNQPPEKYQLFLNYSPLQVLQNPNTYVEQLWNNYVLVLVRVL